MTGKVIDVKTGAAISGASIALFSSDGNTSLGTLGKSGADGTFDIEIDPLTDFILAQNLADTDNLVYFFANGYNYLSLSVGQVSGNIPMAKAVPSSSTTVKPKAASTAVSAYYQNLDYQVDFEDLESDFPDYFTQQADIATKPGTWLPIAIMAVMIILVIVFFKKILKWSVLMPCVLALTLFSCSSVKKVNKDTAKQLSVIDNYQSNHLLKNDTSYIYIPGDTVVSTVFNYDTINNTLPGQIQYKDRVFTKTVTTTKTITDTILQKVTDRTLEYALQKIIEDKNTKISGLQLDVLNYKHKSERWFWFFVGLLTLNTLLLLFKLKII